jgi:hypothetical protein
MYNATLENVIGATLNMTKATIMSEFRTYIHPNKDIQKLIRKTLKGLGGDKFIYRACDFLISGNAAGEITWDTTDKYVYVSEVTWSPTTNLQYQVDQKGRVIGALQPALMAQAEGIFKDKCEEVTESQFATRQIIPTLIPYFLVPRKDLFYIAFDSEFNPYGTSPIRRSYIFYELKMLLLQLYGVAMSRNAVPTMVAYFDKSSVKGSEDLEFMQNQLAGMTVGGIAFIPSSPNPGDMSMKIDAIAVDSKGIGSFLDALEYCDKMMKMCLLGDLVMSGEEGSYSSGFIGKETYRDNALPFINTVKDAINNQIIEPIIRENFPKEYAKEEFGRFIPANMSNSEKMEITKQFEIGASTGIIDPSSLGDVNTYREQMGLPVIEEEKDLAYNRVRDVVSKSTENRGTNTREAQVNKPFSHSDKPFSKAGENK